MTGGHMGPVSRHENTVRRPAGPWTPLVHAYMRGLRELGVSTVPEPIGVDGDVELVEFVSGDVGVYPMPDWVWNDELLIDVARRLREVHDASGSLALPHAGWRLPAVAPAEVICHGDIAPYNTVCRDGRVAAFIDWDFAVPAPRGWDLGEAVYRWVSLTPPGHPDGRAQDPADQRRRLHLFCEAYGDLRPADAVAWAIRRLDHLTAYSRERAGAGDPAFSATIAAGHVDLYEADVAWLRREFAPGSGPPLSV